MEEEVADKQPDIDPELIFEPRFLVGFGAPQIESRDGEVGTSAGVRHRDVRLLWG